MRPNLRVILTILAPALAILPAPADSAEAPRPAEARLYTASDFPDLARGVASPFRGETSVKAWAPARQRWSMAAEGGALTLTARVEGTDAAPAWQDLGTARLPADGPLVVKVAGSGASSPVPALLALAAGPAADLGPALDVVRGRADAIDPPADPRRATVRTKDQGADFHAPATAEAWRNRARDLREQLRVALGLWPMFPKADLHPRTFGKLQRDGYTVERVALETFPGFLLCGNLYRPNGAAGKVPGILCPHGHWPEGRVNPDVQMRCIRWAKLGCVVFSYDMVGYADGKPFGHEFLNDRLRRWGLSLATLQTWNSFRALDWLAALPEVDAARIGCTGESGGGTQTFLLTALDARVAVAAPVVMVSDSMQGGCVCENAAGLRLGTDNVEIAALAAPRPMKLVGATGDWTAHTMDRAFPRIREVYALVGSPDRLSADVFDFPHNYNRTSRDAVYAFMARWLLNVDDPAKTREGDDQAPEAPEEILAFGPSRPAPQGLKSPAQLEADLVDLRSRQLDQLAPTAPAPWSAAREQLRAALGVRVGLVNPAPGELVVKEVRRARRDGLTIEHVRVGRRDSGTEIPAVRLIPARPSGRSTVILSPRGKADLVTADGRPAALVGALLDRGQAVVGFDPLLIGESAAPSAPADRRPDTPHFDTYNPSLAADRAQDLATVLAWARSRPGIAAVNLVGLGSSGPLALLARPALEGVSRTFVDLDRFDYGDGSGAVPAGLDLPGVLQFGGLPAAAALVSPGPLRIARPGRSPRADWPGRAYALDDAAGQLRIEDEVAGAADLAGWLDAGG